MARMDEGSSRGYTPWRPPKPQPPRRSLSKPSRSGGRAGSAAVGRRLSRSGGGPPIRSNSSGRYSPPAAVPSGTSGGGGAVPDINAFLTGDPGYQQQLRQFMKSLNDYSADADRRKGILGQEHGLSKKALADQRLMDLEGIEEDFSSRGLQRSGLYGEAVGDYEKEYGTRVSDLDRRQQQALQQLIQERSQYHQQNLLQQQAAKEQALRRRAEQYGV